jgi:hypothetical protein
MHAANIVAARDNNSCFFWNARQIRQNFPPSSLEQWICNPELRRKSKYHIVRSRISHQFAWRTKFYANWEKIFISSRHCHIARYTAVCWVYNWIIISSFFEYCEKMKYFLLPSFSSSLSFSEMLILKLFIVYCKLASDLISYSTAI